MKEDGQWFQTVNEPVDYCLKDGSTIAVVGGGPSGSMFAYFLLETAARAGIHLIVDIYEPRDFTAVGPAGCNMCGGIVSESLVEILATEGIVLPPQVVQRGIDSYVLHTDAGDVRIDTPTEEKRIAVVHRGAGPEGAPGCQENEWNSFDDYLLTLAVGRGALLNRQRVKSIRFQDGRPQIEHPESGWQTYDLLTIATGINAGLNKMIPAVDDSIIPPDTVRTAIREFFVGKESIGRLFGSSMHMFLLNIPRLEFGAIIPKGEYASICLLGQDINEELVSTFLESQVVKRVMPSAEETAKFSCRCMPRMAVSASSRPYANRVVFIGDAGATRLYKDGIGSAYKTAKSAAMTAVLHDVSADAFQKFYEPVCKSLNSDNQYGKLMFLFTSGIRRSKFSQRFVLKQVQIEQAFEGSRRHMSMVLWDIFTGSASYKDIFFRALRPAFIFGLLRSVLMVIFTRKEEHRVVAQMN